MKREHLSIDTELTTAINERHVQVEHRINIIRGAILILLMMTDIVVGALWGVLSRLFPIYLVPIVTCSTYWYTVHRLSSPGQPYRPFLKYVTISVDFLLLIVFGLETINRGIFPGFITQDAMAFILIFMAIIINSANFYRVSKTAILYSTGLALGISLFFILSLSSSYTFSFIPFVVFIPMGVVAINSSSQLTDIFLKLYRREKLTRFLPKEVVEEIDSGRISMTLGGEKKDVTVLLCDIRDFTTMSEDRDPSEVIPTLNTFFTAMSDVIFDHGGMVDKFIGDAVLAVFGIPIPKDDDAERAVSCALKMFSVLRKINRERQEAGEEPLHMGIAINTGTVVAGNIGSPQRMEYTIIGDTANLTARIEGKNRELHTDILMTEATALTVRERVPIKEVQEIAVRGRVKKVKLFTVTGERGL
jgi:class 3 adenylate cyclase